MVPVRCSGPGPLSGFSPWRSVRRRGLGLWFRYGRVSNTFKKIVYPVSVGRSVGSVQSRSVGRSFGRSVGRFRGCQSFGRAVGQSLGRPVGRSVSQSVGSSVSRAVGQSFGRLVGRSIWWVARRFVARLVTCPVVRSGGLVTHSFKHLVLQVDSSHGYRGGISSILPYPIAC